MKNLLYIIGIAAIYYLSLTLNCCAESDSLSKLELSFSNNESISYQAQEKWLQITCYNEWEITVTCSNNANQWCYVSPSKGSGNSNSVVSITENASSKGREATICLTSNDRTFNLVISQEGNPDLESQAEEENETESEDTTEDNEPSNNTEGSETIDPTKVNAMTSFPLWMELPDITKPYVGESAVVSHNVEIGSESVRSYTMLYDTVQRIAYWVAYPISSKYIGEQSRTDKWGYDPKVPEEYQANLTSSFPATYLYNESSHNLYDRGHILPSASRTANYTANVQTFYYTNMTAQHWHLNRYMWANLESKVRDWATDCDTLYVVTGVKLTSPITYTQDKDGKDIALAENYFKVVLSLNSGEYNSIGFWLANDYCSTSENTISSFARSVAEIEALTGYNFFAQLDDPSVKTEFLLSDWDM